MTGNTKHSSKNSSNGRKNMSTFETLNKLDVSEHVEKKGKFTYLSWPYAVAELRKHCPDATWKVERFPVHDGSSVFVPYMKTEMGYFVEVSVTVDGITLSQIHPVLNNQNRPIPEPSPFDINTSIQRALVKAIALHGLGLYIYAGEDLPPDVKAEQDQKAKKALADAASKGTEALRQEWEKLNKEQRMQFKEELDKLKSVAAEADQKQEAA